MKKTALMDLVALGEGFTTEFKRAGTSNLGREICAFANVTEHWFTVIFPRPTGQDESQASGEARRLGTISVPSPSQVCPKSVPSDLAEMIMRALTSPVDMLRLMALARYTNRTRFRKTVLQPLIDADLMELTIPDKPRSSKQRYRLTELGQELLKRQGKEQS